MKRILPIAVVALLCFSACGSSGDQPEKRNTKFWKQTAEGMSRALIEHFWGASFEGYPDRYYFNYQSDLADLGTGHYWPQAHAMDVIVDAYMRTGNKDYLAIYPLWWEGAPKFNFAANGPGPWWNPYVDDMEWIVLAQLRMYETANNEEYFTRAKQIYNDWIWTTWGPEDEEPWFGGITWKTDVNKSKNACSNGPAAIIAARIYNLYDKAKDKGDKPKETYLEEAKKIYAWERDNLYDPQNGAIRDNMNAQGRISRAVYTYNSGTFIGAAVELYRITGDKQYLEEAVNAANYVIDEMSKNEGGVLSDATGGDGGLFHGIFFRYFVKLINEKDLDIESKVKFHDYLTHLANVMYDEGINKEYMLYGGSWHNPPASSVGVGLTPHLSGCMLMEAMCVLDPLPKNARAKTEAK